MSVNDAHADAIRIELAPACSTAFSRHTEVAGRAGFGSAAESVVRRIDCEEAAGGVIGVQDGERHTPNTP